MPKRARSSSFSAGSSAKRQYIKHGGGPAIPTSVLDKMFSTGRVIASGNRRYDARTYDMAVGRKDSLMRALNARTGGLSGQELKYIDHLSHFSLLENTWTLISPAEEGAASPGCCNGVPQGSTASERIGNRITQKNLSIRGRVTWNYKAIGAVVPTDIRVYTSPVRIVVVLDTQANSAQPTFDEVFQTISPSDVVAPYDTLKWNDLAGPNIEHTKRFRTLKTEMVCPRHDAMFSQPLESGGAGAEDYMVYVQNFEMFIDLKGLVTTFGTGVQGVIGNLLDNAIHVFAIAVAPTANGFADTEGGRPDVDYWSRVRYYG